VLHWATGFDDFQLVRSPYRNNQRGIFAIALHLEKLRILFVYFDLERLSGLEVIGILQALHDVFPVVHLSDLENVFITGLLHHVVEHSLHVGVLFPTRVIVNEPQNIQIEIGAILSEICLHVLRVFLVRFCDEPDSFAKFLLFFLLVHFELFLLQLSLLCQA
jgi:hypothetical protein